MINIINIVDSPITIRADGFPRSEHRHDRTLEPSGLPERSRGARRWRSSARRDGQPVLAVGATGGRRIVNAVLRTITAVVGEDPTRSPPRGSTPKAISPSWPNRGSV